MGPKRRTVLFGAVSIGAVVAMASVSFACVQTRGRITVNGTVGVSSATGSGQHPGTKNVGYCGPIQANAQAPASLGFAPNQRASVTVTLGAGTGSCATVTNSPVNNNGPNAFPDSTYEVMFCPGRVFQSKGGTIHDVSSGAHGACFFTDGVGDDAVQMGFLTVAGGSGSGTFKIPGGATANGPSNSSGISVRDAARTTPYPGPPVVNMAPITLL